MPEMWAKLLFTYGPYGLLVFIVLVTLPKARRDFLEKATTDRRPITRFVYALNWAVVFALIAITMVVWMKNSIQDQAIIHGRLLGLAPSSDLKSPFEDFYLRRVYESKTQAAFLWRIISPRREAPGTMVPLFLDQSTPDHEDVTIYELPITDELYNEEVTLTYDRKNHKLLLERETGAVPLKEMNTSLARQRIEQPVVSRPRLELIPAAYAQIPEEQKRQIDFRSISDRLESNDSVVRYQARADLAAMGSQAMPFIQNVLSDPQSSYRLRLGAIVALNKMPTTSLPAEAYCAVTEAANSKDETMKEQAVKYLSSHSNGPISPRCKLQLAIQEKLPDFPASLKNARSVYVSVSDPTHPVSFAEEEQEAIGAVEKSIERWGKLAIVHDAKLADIVLTVECHPSQDVLAVYDAHKWPGGTRLWHMGIRNGLKDNEILVRSLERAFQNSQAP